MGSGAAFAGSGRDGSDGRVMGESGRAMNKSSASPGQQRSERSSRGAGSWELGAGAGAGSSRTRPGT